MAYPDSCEDKRPSAWNLFDALTFGLLAVLVTGLAAYVQAHDVVGPVDSKPLTWVVAGAFWVIYGLLLRARYRFIQSYDLVLSTGTMVQTNGYKVPRAAFETELRRVCSLWTPHFTSAQEILERKRVWVRFEPGLLVVPFSKNTPRTFAGLTSMGGESVRVTYRGDPLKPLEQTAFAHELGHVIIGRATNEWDNDAHHKFMSERKLP